jgi:hypothetical protein
LPEGNNTADENEHKLALKRELPTIYTKENINGSLLFAPDVPSQTDEERKRTDNIGHS